MHASGHVCHEAWLGVAADVGVVEPRRTVLSSSAGAHASSFCRPVLANCYGHACLRPPALNSCLQCVTRATPPAPHPARWFPPSGRASHAAAAPSGKAHTPPGTYKQQRAIHGSTQPGAASHKRRRTDHTTVQAGTAHGCCTAGGHAPHPCLPMEHLNCVPRSLTKAWPSQAAWKRGTSATSLSRRYARECSSSLALHHQQAWQGCCWGFLSVHYSEASHGRCCTGNDCEQSSKVGRSGRRWDGPGLARHVAEPVGAIDPLAQSLSKRTLLPGGRTWSKLRSGKARERRRASSRSLPAGLVAVCAPPAYSAQSLSARRERSGQGSTEASLFTVCSAQV